MIMYLDRRKASKLLKEELKKEGRNLVEVNLILAGDEFWNTEEIYPKKQKDFKCYPESYWAMPMIEFVYGDGKLKRLPCFKEKTT